MQFSKDKSKKLLKVAFDITYYIIMAILVVMLITSLIAKVSQEDGRKTIFGYSPTLVASGSMLPTLQINALCIVKTEVIENIEVGDIIVYYEPTRKINIIHRVIEDGFESGERYLVTKGDNNALEDTLHTTEDSLVGKVVLIWNGFGYFASNIIQNGSINRLRLLLSCIEIIVVMYLVFLTICILVDIIFKPFRGKQNYIGGIEDGIQSKQERGDSGSGSGEEE